jgi:hypothetical protein
MNENNTWFLTQNGLIYDLATRYAGNTGVLCIVYYERFDDTKEVIRSRKSKNRKTTDKRSSNGLTKH